MLTCFSVTAQEKDVTTFLGIPVDGLKSEMIQKLKAKGFTPSLYSNEILEGEFNGYDVNVHIATNNNKVYRIMLCDKPSIDEVDIKIRFNKLCSQFENNPRYITLKGTPIPEDEDISYNVKVNKKRYEAAFLQMPKDTLAIATKVRNFLLTKYTEEQLSNPTEEISSEIAYESYNAVMSTISKKCVWFMISEFESKYYITMYYDNTLNQSNGEDL